jgi:hypothetical protein
LLPILLLFLQFPLTFDGTPVSIISNALGLAGALYAVPEVRGAGATVLAYWRKPKDWREQEIWRALLFCHIAVVPPWFFLPLDSTSAFSFPLLQGLGVITGLLRLVKRSRSQSTPINKGIE